MVGGDGGIVVEDYGSVDVDSVAGLYILCRGDGEAYVAFAATRCVVDWQEAHLAAGRFETGLRVDALENPEGTSACDIDASGDVDPYAQGLRDVEATAIVGRALRYGEHIVAKAEVAETEGGDILRSRDRIAYGYARGRSCGEIGVVFEGDVIHHLLGGSDIVHRVVPAFGTLDFVGVLRALQSADIDGAFAHHRVANSVVDVADKRVSSVVTIGQVSVGPAVVIGCNATDSTYVEFNLRNIA